MSDHPRGKKQQMARPAGNVLYVLVMVAVIVALDVAFFRHRTWFWERLASNIGVVLLFGAFYFRFVRSS